MCQLAKLPVLYHHFAEHKALNSRLSFSHFLWMHYLERDTNDHDDDRDMQLPFKKLDHHAPAFVYLPVQKIIPVRQEFYWHTRQRYNTERREDHVNPALGALFRPPQA